MRIGNTISSLQVQRQLSTISKAFARSLEKLASGRRINSAKDGAAELAISSGLEAQQRGLRQAVRNINDARGYGETLAGVISTQTGIVQRMKELSLQSANGILNSEQRGYLNSEFQELYNEFNRLSSQSEFNGEKIADGSFVTKTIQAGTKKGETISLSLPSLLAKDVFVEERGSGAFTSYFFQGRTGSNTIFSDSGDLNNDGLVDIGGTSGATNFVQLSLGDGSFSGPITAFTITGSTGTWTGIKDLNGDGNADLFETTTNGYIVTALGNGDGTFQTPNTFAAATGSIRDIQAGDINDDGKIDLVVGDFAATNTVSIFLGNGDGTFQTRTTLAMAGGGAYSIELVDINNDDRMDIVAGNAGTNGTVFLNQGNSGTFQTVVLPFAASSIDTADLNNDGNKDLIFSWAANSFFGVAFGNGDGTFQTPVTYNSPSGVVYDPILTDLNGDSYLDATWSNNTNGDISYAFGGANGTFSSVATLAGSSSNNMIAADINNDGAIDLVQPGGTRWRTYLGIPAYTSAVDKMSITTESEASDVLAVLDNALGRLASANATIGAVLNRLDSAQSVSLTLGESLTQARSQIEDTDYSDEMAEFTRLQILQSAAIAVMGQNQMNMRLVLKLLNF